MATFGACLQINETQPQRCRLPQPEAYLVQQKLAVKQRVQRLNKLVQELFDPKQREHSISKFGSLHYAQMLALAPAQEKHEDTSVFSLLVQNSFHSMVPTVPKQSA